MFAHTHDVFIHWHLLILPEKRSLYWGCSKFVTHRGVWLLKDHWNIECQGGGWFVGWGWGGGLGVRVPSGTTCRGAALPRGYWAHGVLTSTSRPSCLAHLQLSQQIPFKLELAGAWLSGPFRAAVLFVSQGTFGDVWWHFWLSQLRECYWHLAGRGQRCC